MNASQLTLTCFDADMVRAHTLLMQVAFSTRPITLDVDLSNKTANFTSRATRARIWLRAAVDLCSRHGITLCGMRRVTKAERAAFAYELALRVRDAQERAAVDAIDITIDSNDAPEIIFMYPLNTRLTSVKQWPRTSPKESIMLIQRLAIAVSILAICLAGVACTAHAVYQ